MSDVKFRWEPPVKALELWKPEIQAATDDDATINIYDVIGEDMWSQGMTAKVVSSVLRKAGGEDVTVNINSPGGDFFEGLAIHTLLSDYEGRVKVRVVGLAASAASVIAMAGDDVEIAESGFLMIHNAWTVALGNRNDLAEAASMLEKFDKSMVSLYASKTGMDQDEIAGMMDKETWVTADEAIDMGFASAVLNKDKLGKDEKYASKAKMKKIDIALAKAGIPRSERRSLLKNLDDTPGAIAKEGGDPATPSAGDSKISEVLATLLENINQLKKETENV